MIIVGLAVAVVASAVTVASVVAGRPEPACACSIEPNLRGPARDAAVRFEAVVRQGDVAGAWPLLTDAARTRYDDIAGFRPVFDRLHEALNGTGGPEKAADGWHAVDDRMLSNRPSEVVVVRHETGPTRMVWSLLVLAPLGHVGDERVDPEPPVLRLTAVRDGDRVRVERPGGDLSRASFVAIDSAGQESRPGREGGNTLFWSRPPEGPVVIVAVERGAAGPRIGAAVA
ncbi:hypothetical protein JIG36_23405 [Actinoplanes sp. LDG1-06]|uniref:Uncharacterized protein n=1 Tax=Paractinoplanes ovalisporus TaxID=2810368 RepID=A0ABS2AFA3_9ACTN|nr:hypothetical protein [Actinoplanes ovalisporus]MBM2618508.1 hypothetical protein [Actinoplanes ovalisporus]